MSEKHLCKGDVLPPPKADVLRIYSMRFCPYAQRTRLALAYKQIPHECVNVHLKNKPEWFTDRNPRGLVPVLEINDQIVYESAICNEYLEELYSEKEPLFPRDPYQRARIRIQIDDFDKLIQNCMYKVWFGSGTPEEQKTITLKMYEQLQKFEESLDGQFFGGEKPGALDLHMWPFFERACILKMKDVELLPADRFPKLTQWSKAMMEIPAVKAVYIAPEGYLAYFKGYVTGVPDFDMDLSKLTPQ